MDKVFLYLLGAGASSQVLPLSSTFAESLATFANDLKKAGPKKPRASGVPPVWGDPRDAFVEAVNWLASESSQHFSVDTFAKKLFFRGDVQNLRKLKAVLSAYLVVEQSRNHVDKRYDAFLASILKFDSSRRISLPKHLRIFTWNYDTQLEKAYYGFCDNHDMAIQDIAFGKHIYRINGRCGTNPPGHIGTSFKAILNTTKKPAWKAGINLYNEYMTNPSSPEPEINFAWEDPTYNKLKNVGINLLSEITDLVVIGYSFPYFNREIDDFIFKQFDNLFRVYLQFPDGEHAAIEERIKKLLPEQAHTIPVQGTDLYFIPDDF
jgi:hypothetical protein